MAYGKESLKFERRAQILKDDAHLARNNSFDRFGTCIGRWDAMNSLNVAVLQDFAMPFSRKPARQKRNGFFGNAFDRDP